MSGPLGGYEDYRTYPIVLHFAHILYCYFAVTQKYNLDYLRLEGWVAISSLKFSPLSEINEDFQRT